MTAADMKHFSKLVRVLFEITALSQERSVIRVEWLVLGSLLSLPTAVVLTDMRDVVDDVMRMLAVGVVCQ